MALSAISQPPASQLRSVTFIMDRKPPRTMTLVLRPKDATGQHMANDALMELRRQIEAIRREAFAAGYAAAMEAVRELASKSARNRMGVQRCRGEAVERSATAELGVIPPPPKQRADDRDAAAGSVCNCIGQCGVTVSRQSPARSPRSRWYRLSP